MNIKVNRILFGLFIILLHSCQKKIGPEDVPVTSLSLLDSATAVSEKVKPLMEGVYSIRGDISNFGQDMVLKWNGASLSGFSSKNSSYIVLKSGEKNGNLYFEGYWRYAESQQTGLISLTLEKDNGASDLMIGKKPASIKIKGTLWDSKTYFNFEMNYIRPLSVHSKAFYIIGHRCGGRNSDRLPASENSLKMIPLSEQLGANAIETDVQLTKDGVPVLFHDDYLSTRLINETYMIGQIRDYTFAQLRALCTLKDGQKIPTLEEALEVVVDKTNLKLVWLDIKGTDVIKALAPLQTKYMNRALITGKKLDILIGLPDETNFNEYVGLNISQNHPAICELNEDFVRSAQAGFWAPRWSLGLLTDRVKQMQKEGVKTFIWTLDNTQLVKRYLATDEFDGFCTNYPSIVAYEYYSN